MLVTGGAGYVGAHCCKALASAGHRPVVVDTLENGHRDFVRWGPLEVGDVCDPAFLDTLFCRYRIAAVMHFAAYISVAESTENPGRYFDNNLGGTRSLLGAMHRGGVNRLIFSGTAAAYGVPDEVPIPIDAELRPINPYGESKVAAEQAIRDSAEQDGLRYAIFRYFNACGADPEGEIGEWHEPETHLIPLALDAALSGRALNVFGDDYPTEDGTCVRDYIHVTDLAEAHVAALQRLLDGGPSMTLNLGTGRGHSVREVIAAVEQISGHKVARNMSPRRAGDPPVLVADPAAAHEQLGWVPRLSNLRTIVQTAWAWESQRRRSTT